MAGNLIRRAVVGLVVVATAVVASVPVGSPALANTYIKEVPLTFTPNGGYIHSRAVEADDALVYAYMYGSDSWGHIDVYVCRTGQGAGDHSYGEMDIWNSATARWAGEAWGDEYRIGYCKLYQSPNLLGNGTPLSFRLLAAENLGTTTKHISYAYLTW